MKKYDFGNIGSIVMVAMMVAFGLFTIHSLLKKPYEYRYAVAAENNNGLHYEYYTDVECQVLCHLDDGTGKTVTYVQRLTDKECFHFYLLDMVDGDYYVDNTIICTFNEADELVGCK